MINPLARNENKKQNDNKQLVSTIIVSRPGVMRQSLRALLGVYPQIWVVGIAGDGLTALSQVLQHKPGLLVIDSNLLVEEIKALLAAAKAKSPETRSLICVLSGQLGPQLRAAGADAIIRRDSSGPQWEETLLRLTQPAAL